MYKITYLQTGNVFELPDETAKELKEKYPSEYRIIEKNGKKFRDKIPQKKPCNTDSVYELVVEG